MNCAEDAPAPFSQAAVTEVSSWSRSTASSGSSAAGSVHCWKLSTIQASCATGESLSA